MDEPQKPEAKASANPPVAARAPLPPRPPGMTRKTKVGLSVAASFLTLIGAVFGIKQFGNPAAQPKEQATPAVAQNTRPAASAAEEASAASAQELPPRKSNPFNSDHEEPRAPAGPTTPAPTVWQNTNTTEIKKLPDPPSVIRQPEANSEFTIPTIPMPPVRPASAAADATGHGDDVDVPPPPDSIVRGPLTKEPKPKQKTAPSASGPPSMDPPGQFRLDPLPPFDPPTRGREPEKTKPGSERTKEADEDAASRKAATKQKEPDNANFTIPSFDETTSGTVPRPQIPNTGSGPASENNPSITVPAFEPNLDGPGKRTAEPAPRIRPVEAKEEPKRPTLIMPAPKADSETVTKDPAPAPKQDLLPKMDLPALNPPTDAAPMPMPRVTAPQPADTKRDAIPVPPVQLESVQPTEPRKEDSGPKTTEPAVRPINKGDGAAGSARPIQPAMVGQDGSFDEDLHKSSGSDDYRTISRRYYEDETYAAALQQYNRDNPGGAGYVRVPPIEVLLKRYPNALPKGETRTASGPAPAALNVPGSVVPASARDYPVYTVGDNGEMLRDIAQKTLGNGDSWPYIRDLNTSVNPDEKIPAGTRLRMPPQARLPQ